MRICFCFLLLANCIANPLQELESMTELISLQHWNRLKSEILPQAVRSNFEITDQIISDAIKSAQNENTTFQEKYTLVEPVIDTIYTFALQSYYIGELEMAQLFRTLAIQFARFLETNSETSKEPKMSVEFGLSQIPDKKKKNPLGEDAAFVDRDTCTFCIADGVGGTMRHGVDSGDFARALLTEIQFILESKHIRPMSYFNHAFKAMEGRQIPGSSTIALAVFDGQYLHSIALGDTQIFLYRKVNNEYRIIKHSIAQVIRNTPFQFGYDSLGNKISDFLHKTQHLNWKILPGDFVVMGSDGLFDNIFPEDISKYLNRQVSADYLAEYLCTKALYFSEYTPSQQEKDAFIKQSQPVLQHPLIVKTVNAKLTEMAKTHWKVTPFAARTLDRGRRFRFGGKPDDISVITAKFM